MYFPDYNQPLIWEGTFPFRLRSLVRNFWKVFENLRRRCVSIISSVILDSPNLQWSMILPPLSFPPQSCLVFPITSYFFHVFSYAVQLLGSGQKSLTGVYFPVFLLTASLNTQLFIQQLLVSKLIGAILTISNIINFWISGENYLALFMLSMINSSSEHWNSSKHSSVLDIYLDVFAIRKGSVSVYTYVPP